MRRITREEIINILPLVQLSNLLDVFGGKRPEIQKVEANLALLDALIQSNMISSYSTSKSDKTKVIVYGVKSLKGWFSNLFLV